MTKTVAKNVYTMQLKTVNKENTMTLLEHIKKINAESKKWMDENPGSWAGMVTEDIQYWNDQGIFTVEDYERDSLITSVYEMHKDAYGVKGRHYNFKEMSNEDLQKELDHLCAVAKEQADAEKKAEEQAYEKFENQITQMMKHGAGNRDIAIKWILQAEGLDTERDPSYICYSLGLSYDKEEIFKTYTMKEAV